METVLSINNLLLKQGAAFSLSIPTLELSSRRIYTLMGQNGAGKSTLLRTMALLTLPERGTVRLGGANPEDLMQQRQMVTLVEQHPYLFKGSVTDNLAFGLKLRGIRGSEQKKRIEDALTRVSLEGFAKRKTSELSGGEVQRIALARALVLEPKLLLLDETTSGIDRARLQIFEEILRKLPEYGVTVVLATHDQLLAERLGGETLLLENGRIVDRLQPLVEPDSGKEKKAWLRLLSTQGH